MRFVSAAPLRPPVNQEVTSFVTDQLSVSFILVTQNKTSSSMKLFENVNPERRHLVTPRFPAAWLCPVRSDSSMLFLCLTSCLRRGAQRNRGVHFQTVTSFHWFNGRSRCSLYFISSSCGRVVADPRRFLSTACTFSRQRSRVFCRQFKGSKRRHLKWECLWVFLLIYCQRRTN